MLTRLKVKGFKNLVDLDVRFGPFTCIAGPNGAGKSNLFDAILDLLQSLATNLDVEVDEENPLRQVILNTHSPEVAALVPPDSLLVTRARSIESGGLQLNPLSGTWRDVDDVEPVPPGTVLEMLHAARAAIVVARNEKREVVGTRRW